MSKKLQFIFSGVILLSILLGISIKKVFNKDNKNYQIEKIERKENELNLTTTYPKVHNKEISDTWKNRNLIQKEWIKVEKDKDGYLIYEPCDGVPERIKFEKGNLIINWRIEKKQIFEYDKFTRLIGNKAFRLDAIDVENKIRFEIKASIIDSKNGIVLWEFDNRKWLMTPIENIKKFRIIKNNCETGKKNELQFLPTENYK